MIAIWSKIVDEPDVFPPEFWQLVLKPILTAWGGRCRADDASVGPPLSKAFNARLGIHLLYYLCSKKIDER